MPFNDIIFIIVNEKLFLKIKVKFDFILLDRVHIDDGS